MPRVSKYNKVLHSLHFTPHQLQAADIARWGADAFSHWVYTQLHMTNVELVEDHRFGFVYVAWKADWVRPFTFRDLRGERANLECENSMTIHSGERDLLRIKATFRSGGEDVATFDSLLNPLKITGTEALDAVPSGVPDDIRALFQADEILETPPPRLSNHKAVIESGELLRERNTPFVLYRHEGELADMWQNPSLAGLDGRAREGMVFDGGDARLKHGLSKPIASISATLRRPIYMHEQGDMYTRAFWMGDHVAYVHEVRGAVRGGGKSPTCATIVVHMSS